MSTSDFVEGDTGSSLRRTCVYRRDGLPVDLTGVTSVELIWRNAGDTADVIQAMTVLGAPSDGVVQYTFTADQLYAPLMEFEIKITDASGLILRNLDRIRHTVRAKLAA